RGAALRPRHELNFAGRERGLRVCTEAHHFLLRRHEVSHRRAMRQNALQHLHRLVEFHRVRMVLQQPAQAGLLRKRYSNTRFPARGGHSQSTSFRWRVRAASTLKLFSDTYSPRKCSSRLANRYTPPPAKFSSSSSTSTRRPRTKLTPSSVVTCVNAGRLCT